MAPPSYLPLYYTALVWMAPLLPLMPSWMALLPAPLRLMNTPDNSSPLSAVPQMFPLLSPPPSLPLTSRPTGAVHENAHPPPFLASILFTTRLLLTALPSPKSMLFLPSCVLPMGFLPNDGSLVSRWSWKRKLESPTLTNYVPSSLWKLTLILVTKCSLDIA